MQVKESLYFLASGIGTESTPYPFVYPSSIEVTQPLPSEFDVIGVSEAFFTER